eukprot:359194-Chlamydomonas_euryale.AAC.23
MPGSRLQPPSAPCTEPPWGLHNSSPWPPHSRRWGPRHGRRDRGRRLPQPPTASSTPPWPPRAAAAASSALISTCSSLWASNAAGSGSAAGGNAGDGAAGGGDGSAAAGGAVRAGLVSGASAPAAAMACWYDGSIIIICIGNGTPGTMYIECPSAVEPGAPAASLRPPVLVPWPSADAPAAAVAAPCAAAAATAAAAAAARLPPAPGKPGGGDSSSSVPSFAALRSLWLNLEYACCSFLVLSSSSSTSPVHMAFWCSRISSALFIRCLYVSPGGLPLCARLQPQQALHNSCRRQGALPVALLLVDATSIHFFLKAGGRGAEARQ